MSLMTDMIVFAAIGDDDAIERLNAWCATNDGRGQQFRPLDTDAAGGAKVFCNLVWAMCGNYFPVEKLVEAFPSFGWRLPDYAVLIIDHEGDGQTRTVRAVEEKPQPVGWERAA